MYISSYSRGNIYIGFILSEFNNKRFFSDCGSLLKKKKGKKPQHIFSWQYVMRKNIMFVSHLVYDGDSSLHLPPRYAGLPVSKGTERFIKN